MDNITTTQEVNPAVAVTYERTLLQPPFPDYVHNQFAKKFNIASKSGNTIKMRRYNRYSAATTPITQGITPNGHKQSKVDLLAEVSQYGDFATITDVVDLTVEDPNILIEVERQADQMQNTDDQLTRDVLAASASSTTCSNGTGGATTLLNRTDIKAVRQILRANNAKFMTSMVRAGTGLGTSPIPPAYWGIADTDLETDLESVAGFKSVQNYAAQKGVDVNEWGETSRIRWLTTTQGFVSGGTYSLPIIAREAYGRIDLDGGNASSIVKAFGSSGTADPLNQRATVGWKMWQVARILNDLFIHVLNCTAA